MLLLFIERIGLLLLDAAAVWCFTVGIVGIARVLMHEWHTADDTEPTDQQPYILSSALLISVSILLYGVAQALG